MNLRDEHVVTVSGLPATAADGKSEATPASDLFVRRAKMTDHDFERSVENGEAIDRICRLVEGMPLAIEMAAARLDLYSAGEIADEIERGLDILSATASDVPDRQQSIEVIFAASWDQLSADEQATLIQLSEFRGGFSRDAAQEVAGATIPILERLVSRSLIRFDRPRLRFQMHELLRQFLAAKLDGAPDLAAAVASRQANYYCNWLHQRTSHLRDARQPAALAEMRLEFANVRIAWQRSTDRRTSTTLIGDAIEPLALFHELDGRIIDGREAMNAAANALAGSASGVQATDSALAYTRALVWRSLFDRALGNPDVAERTIRKALALLDRFDPESTDVQRVRALALLQTGTGRFTTAASESLDGYVESRELFNRAGDRWGEGLALAELGRVMWSSGRLDEAREHYQQSLDMFRDLGNQREVANVLGLMSQLARYQGQPEAALDHAREMLTLTQESGSRFAVASALGNIGASLYFLGRFDEAGNVLSEADDLYQEVGTSTDHAAVLMRRGLVAAAIGEFSAADAWFAASQRIYRSIDLIGSVAYLDVERAMIELARGEPGRAVKSLEQHLENLRGIERPTELSRLFGTLALLDLRDGLTERAIERAIESLDLALASGGRFALLEALTVAVPVASGLTTPERVIAGWRCLAREPWIATNALYRTVVGDYLPIIDAAPDTPSSPEPRQAAIDVLAALHEFAASAR